MVRVKEASYRYLSVKPLPPQNRNFMLSHATELKGRGTLRPHIRPIRNSKQFHVKLSVMKGLDVNSHSCNFQLDWLSFTLL
jgi:hypothetical protein